MSRRAVMLVDDDPALLSVMRVLMQRHLPGIHVEPFESPRLALAYLERREVATILTDLKMKEMDGFALLRGAKALRPTVPVILFSGGLDAHVAVQAANMGAQDALRKPFDREEFLTVLTLALHTYDLAREVRIRQLMTERLSKRVEALRRLIADSHRRPNTIRRIEDIVSASRELNAKSLCSLETSLDRLWHHARLAQARLDMAQQRLLVAQEESRQGLLKRNACRVR